MNRINLFVFSQLRNILIHVLVTVTGAYNKETTLTEAKTTAIFMTTKLSQLLSVSVSSVNICDLLYGGVRASQMITAVLTSQ